MGFTNENTFITKKDKDFTNKLITAFRNASLMGTNVNPRNWPKEFSTLRQKIDDDDMIELVLNWFCANVKKPQCSGVRSARSFRKHFFTLKELSKAEPSTSEQVKLSVPAKRILKRFKDYDLPMRAEKELPWAIQTSLNNRRVMVNKLEYMIRHKVWPNGRGVLEFLLRQLGENQGGGAEFVHQWIADGLDRLSGWRKWSGSLKPIIFSIDSDQFEFDCSMWLNEYVGGGRMVRVYEKLIRNLKDENISGQGQ